MRNVLISIARRSLGCLPVAGVALCVAGCTAPPADARVVSAEEVYVLEQSPLIQGRDGGGSGVAWGGRPSSRPIAATTARSPAAHGGHAGRASPSSMRLVTGL